MKRTRPLLLLLIALTCALPVAEAAWFHHEPPRPGKTTIGKQPVVLPAQLVNNYLIVTVKWDKRGPYNFLIDTGASTCLVSPTLAERYGQPPPPLERNNVTVQSADGDTTVLRSTILKRLQLGNARGQLADASVRIAQALLQCGFAARVGMALAQQAVIRFESDVACLMRNDLCT